MTQKSEVFSYSAAEAWDLVHTPLVTDIHQPLCYYRKNLSRRLRHMTTDLCYVVNCSKSDELRLRELAYWQPLSIPARQAFKMEAYFTWNTPSTEEVKWAASHREAPASAPWTIQSVSKILWQNSEVISPQTETRKNFI